MFRSAKGIARALLTILLPPVGLGVIRGFGYYFWICLILTFMGYVPGLLYAVYRSFYAPGAKYQLADYYVHVKRDRPKP